MLNLQENQIPMAFVLTKGDRIRNFSSEKLNLVMRENRDWEAFYRVNCDGGNDLQKKQRCSKRLLEMQAKKKAKMEAENAKLSPDEGGTT